MLKNSPNTESLYSCRLHIYIGILCNKSFCFISDDTEHDVAMVYHIIQIFTEHLHVFLPHIKKLNTLVTDVRVSTKIRNIYTTCVII